MFQHWGSLVVVRHSSQLWSDQFGSSTIRFAVKLSIETDVQTWVLFWNESETHGKEDFIQFFMTIFSEPKRGEKLHETCSFSPEKNWVGENCIFLSFGLGFVSIRHFVRELASIDKKRCSFSLYPIFRPVRSGPRRTIHDKLQDSYFKMRLQCPQV